jgi:predicted DNA-binding protein (MmcQ/YjbR family)
MVTIEAARQLALSFPETDEHPHFDKKAFRVKKKIFATLDEKSKRMMVKLSPTDQSVFCSFDKTVIYPVPGGWGRQGSTFIELRKVRKEMFRDAVTTAYCTVAPPKLGDPYKIKE